ncbi:MULTISPECIES: IS21 family transposase [Enterococcus]|uniref:IS21 family transposase n=1 Tax=Enterococcus TaxID=1350 RepID=UPI00124CBF84|nr:MULTISPECIES: IS21 family transposase [Enterococcus]GER77371.1 integrase [Enterococcus sp. FM11-1]
MRKDIREGVMIYVINEIKPNYAALAKQYECDYRTVKSAYKEAKEKEAKPTERKKRPSKLDSYKDIIQDKLKDQCSAYSIFKFIARKGFDGSYSLVKTYCREFKQEKVQKATVRVEYTPGLSAQVDWKEDMRLISNQGEIFNFNIFLYVLPYSKKKFITLTFDRKQDTLFECLDDAFYHTGGVPKEIWFDNMKTVVDQSRSQFSKAHFNERFYAFSKDAGFKPIACRPFRPQTKGCVEALARTVDRLRVYNHEFYDAVELCHLVNTLCDELNTEASQATEQEPDELWQGDEKEHLHDLPKNLLNPYFEDSIRRKVTKEAMVIFRKCRYSVEPRYIGKEVEIELSDKEDQVHIYYSGEMIRSHPLTTKQLNYHEEDYFQILKSDVLSHKEDDEIRAYTRESLKQYDLVEVSDEE